MRFVYGKYKGDKTIYYLHNPMALDIETSWNHDEADPKCWITSIQTYFNNELKIFRKPSEWLEYMTGLYQEYDLDHFHRLMIIVHNLSFDISYLMPYLQCEFPYGNDQIRILNKGHKITAYSQGGLEFRDTYALTNRSLATWGKDMNVQHQKKEGLYDYDKIIYQDEGELTSDELLYDTYDVLCLYEAFKEQLQIEADTVATIPYTSTGYIRRKFRRNAINNKEYMNNFRATKIDETFFLDALSSFAGGYTHGNRHLKSRVIKATIGHGDFRSHYPTQFRNYPGPYGPPVMIYDPRNRTRDRFIHWKIKDVLDLFPEYFTITTIYLERAVLMDDKISMPFMQFSKMRSVDNGSKYVLDNGRVLSFTGGCLMQVDNYLLQILKDQYHLKGKIIRIEGYKMMMPSAALIKTVDEYFKAKTDEKIKVKEVIKEYGEMSPEAFAQRAVLQHAKAGLNGCYGMFVQNPIQPEYDIDFTDESRDLDTLFNPLITGKSIQEYLDEFYKNRNSFLQYIGGVAITSKARYELYEYILAIGYDKVLYCDTDSIFYLKDDQTEAAIDFLNRKKHEQAVRNASYITSSTGEKIFYDVFEKEPDGKAFKVLHSKCYGIIEEEKGKDILIATIAGIPARTLIGMDGERKIYLTREEELGGINADMKLQNPDISFDPYAAIDNIKDGFTFRTNTGTCSNYLLERPHVRDINGHMVETSGGCIIRKLQEKQISDFEFGSYDLNIDEGGDDL